MREREREGHLLNPKRKDPFRSGVPRRRVLASTAAVGATDSAAGCLGEDGTDGGDGGGAETVFVFDNGDRTLSIIDAAESPTGAVAGMVRPESDATASLPARIASLGLPIGEMQATHCHDEFCYCG